MEETRPDGALDSLFEALADGYRRRLLFALLEHNPQAETDNRIRPGAVVEEDPPVSEAAVLHAHLPKLEEMGLIDWDRERHEIAAGPRFEEVRPILDRLADEYAEGAE